MPAHASCSLVFAASLCMAAPAAAEVVDAECRIDERNFNLFLDREAIIASYEQLPDRCLKLVFRECSNAANQAMLDGRTAAHCSMSYEALLRRSFGGDFRALMAWWRQGVKK